MSNLDYLQGHNFSSCFFSRQLPITPETPYAELGSGVASVVDDFGALPRLVFMLGQQTPVCVNVGFQLLTAAPFSTGLPLTKWAHLVPVPTADWHWIQKTGPLPQVGANFQVQSVPQSSLA